MVLEKIQKPNDVKKLPAWQLPILASEIREFLITKVSENGGHLASNLGTVELTIALHRCLDFPEDRLIFDVGHQSYTHKILTGRKDDFDTLRKYGGLSGFPKIYESDCDAFGTGHSSTSISAGLGMAVARDLQHRKNTVVSVIGDGALTGGMAYEALNNASLLKSNFIIILNDNHMSISPNVGGMSLYLAGIRTSQHYNELKDNVRSALQGIPGIGDGLADHISRTKNNLKQLMVPGMLFENMGVTYLGPVDGHDIAALTQIIQDAKKLPRAVLIHVRTQKGRGYEPAERHPEFYHGVGPFDRETGRQTEPVRKTWTNIFSDILLRLGEQDNKIVAVTAAMPEGTGTAAFGRRYPDRFFDVGIAEEHAVTFSAGLAREGYHPVCAVYSSFLQRGYDQILHDVCIQKLPVIFAVDRAGIVGRDGETHQGVFDLSYLRMIPGMTVIAPKNMREMQAAFQFADCFQGPVTIRYPRGSCITSLSEYNAPMVYGRAEILFAGSDAVFFAVGSMVRTAVHAARILSAEGISAAVVNLRFVRPLDRETILRELSAHALAVTLEENVLAGGVGEAIAAMSAEEGCGTRILRVGVPDRFVPQGSPEELKKKLGMDAGSVAARVRCALGRKAPEAAQGAEVPAAQAAQGRADRQAPEKPADSPEGPDGSGTPGEQNRGNR